MPRSPMLSSPKRSGAKATTTTRAAATAGVSAKRRGQCRLSGPHQNLQGWPREASTPHRKDLTQGLFPPTTTIATITTITTMAINIMTTTITMTTIAIAPIDTTRTDSNLQLRRKRSRNSPSLLKNRRNSRETSRGQRNNSPRDTTSTSSMPLKFWT